MAHRDHLLLAERAKLSIQLGEGHFREFKSALNRSEAIAKPRPARDIARDVGDTLVAFANADGGELLIGVEDDGRVTGVPHSGQDLDVIVSAPKTHVLRATPLSGVSVATLALAEGRIVFFQVPKGTSQIHQTSDGRCLQRLNTDNRPVPLDHVRYERIERRSREYDREFVDGASLVDLDGGFLTRVVKQIMPGASVDRALQYLDLLTFDGATARLRRAVLLLFGRDIGRWHPRSQVRIIRVLGTRLEVGADYNVHRDEIVNGNILYLIEET